MGVLYRLTSPSGKAYIGISSGTAEQRWAKHKEHALGKRTNGALYAALRKYGCDNFKLETLVIADKWDYLCELEIKAIQAFNTKAPFGYNVTDGGEGVIGPRDEATKLRIAVAQKKRFSNPQQKALLAVYGKRGAEVNSERHSANRIDGLAPWQQRKRANAARNGSPEHRALISKRTKAAMALPEVKAKLAAAVAKKAASQEWREKISKSKLGKKTGPRSEATKLKQSESMKAAWARRKAQKVLND
jgi:hypothetical protein